MAADSARPRPSSPAGRPVPTEEKVALSSADFPPLVSAYVRRVLGRLEKAEGEEAKAWHRALALQFVPSTEENVILPWELADPLGASRHQATPRMIHQYKNRALILTTSRCFAHCRYCFRKSLIAESLQGAGAGGCASCEPASFGWPSVQEQGEMAAYLASHPEIQEALLSGGDPMTASMHQLEGLVLKLRQVRPNLLVRLCTRAAFFQPAAFKDAVVRRLAGLKPLWVVPHINHPAEISPSYAPESRAALERLVVAGIPVQSQTVLLRGVNDDVATLGRLFHELACIGVKPGYLFQCDLVAGTSHLRMPVEEGVALYERLRQELSGLSCPVYAVDLPGGGGKFNLLQLDPSLQPTQVQKLEDCYQFTTAAGSVWRYPR